jgi:hypothetical protein
MLERSFGVTEVAGTCFAQLNFTIPIEPTETFTDTLYYCFVSVLILKDVASNITPRK